MRAVTGAQDDFAAFKDRLRLMLEGPNQLRKVSLRRTSAEHPSQVYSQSRTHLDGAIRDRLLHGSKSRRVTWAGCDRVFQNKISSRVKERTGLLAAGLLRAGDTLCVWKLDRLGRSVKDVLTIADDLHSRGVGLRILTGRLAGTYAPTGEGKFFFTMMAAFGELARDMLQERTFAGLAAARDRGPLERSGGDRFHAQQDTPDDPR